MSLSYDLYQPGDSWLHRLDARCKLLAVLCGSVTLLIFANVWIMVGALLLIHGVLWSSGIARQQLLWVWKALAPTMALIAIMWVLFYPGRGPAIVSFWFVRITSFTLAQGCGVALRLGVLALIVFAWLFSTDQSALVASFVALGLPYEWGLTLAIALRYLPGLANTFHTISDAQQARGLDLSRRGLLQRAQAYIPITVTMVISALRTAETLARVLESRALGANVRRTHLRVWQARTSDGIACVAILAACAGLFWARFALGWGADALRLWP